jgi:hypothetical protein
LPTFRGFVSGGENSDSPAFGFICSIYYNLSMSCLP